MRARNALALGTRAVDCDALARGEQVFLLRPQRGGTSFELQADEFWLHPVWDAHRAADLIDPYRDRARALEELRHGDGRVRIKHYGTAEYVEDVEEPHRLLRLDGEHTLNARAVEDLFRRPGGGSVTLLVVRTYERPEAAVLPRAARSSPQGPWRELEAAVSTSGLEPVLDDDAFLTEKARILQSAGSVEAV